MTQPNPNSSTSNQFVQSDGRPRCHHRTAAGRRCRIPAADSQSGLCGKHLRLATPPIDVAATLTANLDDFTDPEQINTFLSRLLLLLAQQKISTRQAAVLTYITSQLLRTLPAIQKQDNQVEIVFDSPRSLRPGPVVENPAAATSPTAPTRNPANATAEVRLDLNDSDKVRK